MGHQELHNYAVYKKHIYVLFEAIGKHAATKKWTPSRSTRWRIMAAPILEHIHLTKNGTHYFAVTLAIAVLAQESSVPPLVLN